MVEVVVLNSQNNNQNNSETLKLKSKTINIINNKSETSIINKARKNICEMYDKCLFAIDIKVTK